MMARVQSKPALRPFLPTDAPLLAEIFRASVAELTGEDYSATQQEAWESIADDEAAFAARLADALTLLGTIDGSPVGFASLADAESIDMLEVHTAAVGRGVGTMHSDGMTHRAASRSAPRPRPSARRRQRQRAGFLQAPRFRGKATQQRPPRQRVAGEHDHGKAACRQGARAMNRPRTPLPRFQRHHLVIAVIAIVVAVALVLNYYLW